MEKAEAMTEKPKRKTAAKSAAADGAGPKKTTRAKKASAAPGISSDVRHQMICDAAYFRAERIGCANGGDDVENWLAAEAEIDAMLKKDGLSS
ncbi:MAG: DUF2934 domain-containing protein [Burkholderiales bacterium]|nr:DUF2934 domain-containing protein [Burkholderiales bacterium]